MNEPDRPRRDVSIEEAERMPMTDEELPSPNAGDLMVYETMALYLRRRVGGHAEADAIDALVAEVRWLRERLDTAQTAYLSVRHQLDVSWLTAQRMENDAYIAGWNAAVAHDNPKAIQV